MKIKQIFLVCCIFLQSCQAAIFWHSIEVLQETEEMCGYMAMVNAACFIGTHGQVLSAAKPVSEKLGEFAVVVAPANATNLRLSIAAWQPAVARLRTTGKYGWVTRDEVNGYIISLIPKFFAWRDIGQLMALENVAHLAEHVHKVKSLLDKGLRASIILNIGSDIEKQRLVTLGLFQQEKDLHISTMDSASVSLGNPFANKSSGLQSDLVVEIEKFFTSTYSGIPSTSVPGNESAIHLGLPLLGGPALVGAAALVGLNNQGATCYQNAVVQALHKSSSFCAKLKERFDAQVALGGVISPLITRFFEVLRSLDGNGGAHNPRAFCVSLNANRPDFTLYSQQDASEFLTVLWARLQAAAVVPPDVQKNMAQQPIVHPACDGFHGIAQQDRLVCTRCNSVRIAPPIPNYTYMLALAIPLGLGSFSLNELIAHHIALEAMNGGNAVECPTCGSLENHTKEVRFSIFPDQKFIVLQVKRFEFGGLAAKRSNPIILPENGLVTINDSFGVAHNFKVSAVVVHAGGVGGGHYWTVTPSGVYNDSVVSVGGDDMKTVLSSGLHDQPGYVGGTGYLYFLERV